MCDKNKMDMYLERYEQYQKEVAMEERFFDDMFELMFQDGLTKEKLKEAIDRYGSVHLYHLMFEMFGDELSKEEYINLKNRYIQTFGLDVFPLPVCCEKLAKKWGIKNT